MKIITNYAGLEYVTITFTKDSITALEALEIEKQIAKMIIKKRPLRGREIYFLRKQLDVSCAKMAVMLKGALDASTIGKWEKKKEQRLAPINEMAMRIFFAEQFGIELIANFRILIPQEANESIEYAA